MKTLCDLKKKDLDKLLPEISEMVRSPKYICRKCARAAGKKGLLCAPAKLSEILGEGAA